MDVSNTYTLYNIVYIRGVMEYGIFLYYIYHIIFIITTTIITSIFIITITIIDFFEICDLSDFGLGFISSLLQFIWD
jgi:hypothetical protein